MRNVSSTTAAAAAAVLLLLAGCSDPQGTEPGDAAATAGAAATSAPGSSDDARSPGGGRNEGRGGGNGPGGSAQAGAGGGGGRGSRGSGRGGGGAGGAPGPRGSTSYPSAGDYVYAQDGWERFCQGPSCEKERLPETATTSATYSERSADGAVIVTETRSSQRQKLTTTTRYRPARAVITRVVVDFDYSGFTFSQSYDPQPPIEALRFPLGAQDAWRGRWKARTSGDYRVRVAGREDVAVGGRIVSAWRLETVTNFKGDFSGRAQMSVWIDPATAMVVRTDGQLAVASGFGEYTSSFATTLRSGPGY